MGEIANDMISGACCERCGVYFEKDHGHPVLCIRCMKALPKTERKNHAQAYYKEL